MILALALSATLASSPASCESLKSLSLPNTTIVAAEMVAAGPFTAPCLWRRRAAGCRRRRTTGDKRRTVRRLAGADVARARSACRAAADAPRVLPRERDPQAVG